MEISGALTESLVPWDERVAPKLATDSAKPGWSRAKGGCLLRDVLQWLCFRMIQIANRFPFSLNRALEHVLKKVSGFFDSGMLQLFDIERRPCRSNVSM